MKPTEPWIFRYTGINAMTSLRKTYYVEVEPDEVERMTSHPIPSTFAGKVIKSDIADRYVGEYCGKLVSPIYDMLHYGNSCFQRVNKHDI